MRPTCTSAMSTQELAELLGVAEPFAFQVNENRTALAAEMVAQTKGPSSWSPCSRMARLLMYEWDVVCGYDVARRYSGPGLYLADSSLKRHRHERRRATSAPVRCSRRKVRPLTLTAERAVRRLFAMPTLR